MLDQFIGAWFPRPRGPSGLSKAELDAAEGHLGFCLPVALRQWYERFGARRDVWSLQDHLLTPVDWERVGGVLVLCVENQNVVQWGIELDSISDDDPPIVVSNPDHYDQEWLIEAGTTTEFALQFAAVNAKFSDAVEYHANGQVTDAAIDVIERSYARLPFGEIHWPAYPTRLYAGPDVLVEINGLTWVWISARTRTAFESVLSALRSSGVIFEYCTYVEPVNV